MDRQRGRESERETERNARRGEREHTGEGGGERGGPRNEEPKGWSRIEGDGAKRAFGARASECPDEKSVIIIITAGRTTIINHH